MRSIPACLLLVLVLAGQASEIHAQSPELRPGARVRITAPGLVADRLEATILSRAGDTIEVASPNLAPIRIPLARTTAIEVSRGRSAAAGAITGLKWGVGIGAPFGVLAAIGARCQTSRCNTVTAGDRFAIATMMTASGALWGTAIGAAVGAERWVHVPLNEHAGSRVSPLLSPTRLGVRVSF